MANFTLNKTSGTGSTNIVVSTSTNLGRATKTGTVTITSKVDATKKATVALTQGGTAKYWSVVTAPTLAEAMRKITDAPTVDTFTSVGVFKTNINSYCFKLDTAASTANLPGRLKKVKIEISADNATWTVVQDTSQTGWTADLLPSKIATTAEFEKNFAKYGLNAPYYIRISVGFAENSKDAAQANMGIDVYLGDKTTKVADLVFSQKGYTGAVSLAVDAATKTVAANATSATIKLTTNSAWTASVV